MTSKRRVIVNAFFASFAGTLLQRGVYFFTHDILGFTQAQNLWLALLVGITYIAGATSSHKLATRFGERRALLGILLALALAHALLAGFSSAVLLVPAIAAIAAIQGAMWPLFESYMSAGETPQSLAPALTRYNISWALSVPASLALAGPLIASGSPRSLFVVATALYVGVAVSCSRFPSKPVHLDAGHADRPDERTLVSYRALLLSARFAMIGGYALMYVLAPLMPEIMKHVGFGIAAAARASGLIDVARLACFVSLFAYSGWHGKKLALLVAVCAMPLGFVLTLFGPSIAAVVPGELLFGGSMGFLYTAALYYAQVVENASVDAGGAHEALIGLGYALGPSAGLIGSALAHGDGPGSPGYVRGMAIATAPLIVACVVGALRPLLRARRSGAPASP
ncbi:MAG TPA: MFS transporter [Polyangiaceae bacterium]